ncbi:MAG: GNAT family N-acetyltransferase [Desulfovibrio sp.]|uniref:GNAT family N-acetyltransferase n=1 Tax=Desulfovibrio sp. TaxID=885 RepID=UPI00135E7E47|nr:GNAT family N-acetyltransferase [Desulfovibrio sp.]MTJ92057.1 GNAT family N-acetyltransferase [Desulfovibrio sp.]
MNILPVRQQDLSGILALQKAAFTAEAQLVNDWNIPPMTQTLDELAEDLRKGIILKAVNDGGALVGTVRGHLASDGFYIGRLAVLPQWQGRGCGSALLEAIIAHVKKQGQTNRLVLFTSTRSERNLRLYGRFGFRPFKKSTTATGVPLVWLERV